MEFMKNNLGMFCGLPRLGMGAGLRRWAVVLGLVCFGFVTVDVAQAGVYSGGTYSFPTSTTPYDNFVSVNQINTAGWGTVDSITITLTATMVGTASIQNESGVRQTVTSSTFGGILDAYAPDGNVLLDVTAPTTTIYTGQINNGATKSYTSPDGGLTLTETYTISASSLQDGGGTLFSDNGTTAQDVINEFLGGGTVQVELYGIANVGYNATAGMVFSSSANMGGSFSLSYDVVPEPDTWISGALLLGVVGVGAGRSLRRKGNQAVA
jgi:hypothetical protein